MTLRSGYNMYNTTSTRLMGSHSAVYLQPLDLRESEAGGGGGLQQQGLAAAGLPDRSTPGLRRDWTSQKQSILASTGIFSNAT